MVQEKIAVRSKTKNRLVVGNLKEHAGDHVKLLRTLRVQHGFNHTHLSTMRIDGVPITREHLALASCSKIVMDGLRDAKLEPSRKILTRSISVAHLGYLASLYDALDPHWRTHRSVDAKHLLESWEVFVVSVMPSKFDGRRLRALPDPSLSTSLELRTHWMTIKAMTWNLIDLVRCGECGRPYLRVAEAAVDSNWGLLPARCMCCAHISKVRSRHGVAKSSSPVSELKFLARNTPSEMPCTSKEDKVG